MKIGGQFCVTFGERALMETLPFTHYGFQLYNLPEVKALVSDLPLALIREHRKKDKIFSKSGEIVNREFVSLVFTRTA